MKEIRRLKITATRRRLARYRQPAIHAFCPACAREVETLSAAQAAEALEVAAPRLDQLIAEGLVHAIATVSGSLRICQNSLYQVPQAV
jgi:ribosomal protein S20